MAQTIASTLKMSNGYNIPRLGLGVYKSASPKQATSTALLSGYLHVDTAQAYENEVEVVNSVVECGINRENLFITTKIVELKGGVDAVKKRAQESIEVFKGIGYIDLLLLHAPIGGAEVRKTAWQAIEQTVGEGHVRSIGVSNYGVKHLKELLQYAHIKPVVNQIELHPFCQQKDIVEFCEKENILVEAYTPLTRGKKFDNPTLKKIAEKHKKEPAQILIKWCLQRGYIPLPKSDKEERIKSNADVYDFELDEKDMSDLNGLDQGKAGSVTWNPVDSE